MNFAVKLWQNHEHLRYFRNVSLPQNHKVIYFALSFFLTTHVPDIFLVFVWVCGLSVKRSTQGFIYLICQENSFLQKGASIYGILNFFLHKNFISYISAHFTERLLSGNVLEISLLITSWISNNFYNKGTTSKVTAEDGSVPLAVSGIPGIKSFF